MADTQVVDVPVDGMDCAECTEHVQKAIAGLPGVQSVQVFLSSQKAVIRLDPTQVTLEDIAKAVVAVGYSVPALDNSGARSEGLSRTPGLGNLSRRILVLLGVVFGAVLFVVVAGEWLGLFETISKRVPFPIGLAIVLAFGYRVFRKVILAALKRQIISHTLMTFGVLAALVIGEWATAAVVTFFMRVGEYAENFTTERARRAVKGLTNMAPQTARVEHEGVEQEVLIGQVRVGDTVIVRPGEKIPVDGEVVGGHATIDQAAITGESMPVEAGSGSRVYAASLANLGSLRIRATGVGKDTTFGRVIKMVEEAEGHRAKVQSIADRFSGYYLPVVLGIAALTLFIRRDPLATAAVLVVACSCSFALATPIAMLASIGAGAKRGLLIKGGKYLESLARADMLLIDKTGTLTLGKPHITDILPLNGASRKDVLFMAASVERYSEHPLAEAVREAARGQGLTLGEPEQFEAIPGLGVRAQINGSLIAVGNRRMVPEAYSLSEAEGLEAQGKTLLFIACNGEPVGMLAAADTLRPEIPEALAALKSIGMKDIELLTGDNERTAEALSATLGVRYRANLLPEDKVAIVKDYQARGRTVVMVGDGVNDAPALAQADVGIAMGAAGTDIAIEAAHIALMRDDWMLVPNVFRIARATIRVVKMNIVFTAVYNLAGLSLAAMGFLPPIFAAAAQSLPDIGILANSSRLLRQK